MMNILKKHFTLKLVDKVLKKNILWMIKEILFLKKLKLSKLTFIES